MRSGDRTGDDAAPNPVIKGRHALTAAIVGGLGFGHAAALEVRLAEGVWRAGHSQLPVEYSSCGERSELSEESLLNSLNSLSSHLYVHISAGRPFVVTLLRAAKLSRASSSNARLTSPAATCRANSP
jgi:hypothetical protein